ncbi:MAG: hypothetical protein ACYC9O_08520, partial [Candidatus Latescibacterota bacterium]
LYFKLDAAFTMADRESFYFSTMRNSGGTIVWSTQIRRSGTAYQILVFRGGTGVGAWVTINRGQWSQLKVHYRNGNSGMIEWFVNNVSRGSYTGALGTNTTDTFYAMNLLGIDASTRGKLLIDSVLITRSDSGGAPVASEALFEDSFTSGNLSNWSSVSSGILVGSEGNADGRGVEYAITSTTQKNLAKNLPAGQSETYTSLYFKLDAAFTMADGESFYFSTMRNSGGTIVWSTQIRRSGTAYQILVFRGGTGVGAWVTINRGQWSQLKVHYRNGNSGVIEWFVNNISRGSYAGVLGTNTTDTFYALNLLGIDASTRGKLLIDSVLITRSDSGGAPAKIEAENITLTDAAGNVSAPASSSGSSLRVVSYSVAKIASGPRESYSVMLPSIEAVSETCVFFSPASESPSDAVDFACGRIEAMNLACGGNTGNHSDSTTVLPCVRNGQQSMMLRGLKPGACYSLSMRGNGHSHSPGQAQVTVTTFAAFVDEDLDPQDPYINRDCDSLFVADNDCSLAFVWTSWEALGGVSYRVTILAHDPAAVISTQIVKETRFEFTGEPGRTYSLEIHPLDASGEELGTIGTRAIRCAPARLNTPKKLKIRNAGTE